MELEDAIYHRRSVRKYNDIAVKKDIILEIINAGIWAPSACNVQGWRFIVIDDKTILDKIVKLGSASFLKGTHQAILVLYDNQTDNLEYSDDIQSAAACIQNMLLRAHSLQVGTCWVNNLPRKKKLKKLLGIPHQYSPVALVALGYYSQQIYDRPRKMELADCVSYNVFNFKSIEKKNSLMLLIKRFARKVYKTVPFNKKMQKIAEKMEKKFNN